MKQKVIPIIADDDDLNFRKDFNRESSFNYSNRRSFRGSFSNSQYYEDNIEEEPELTYTIFKLFINILISKIILIYFN